MNISYKSLFKRNLFLVIASILFFKPPILDYYNILSGLNLFFNYCRIGLCIFVLFGHICSVRFCIKRKSIFLSMFLFFVWISISTYIGKENVQHVVLSALYAFSFSIYFRDGLQYNRKYIIKSLYYVILTLVIVNLILFITLPNGIIMSSYYSNKIHFLGTKNGFTGYVEPLLVLGFIQNNRKYCNKFVFVFSLLVSIITAFISDSSTGILSVFVLLLLISLQKNRNIDLKRYKKYIVVLLVISFFIVFFRIQNYFSFFIEGVFGKSVDLTNRTVIWDAAIIKIKQSPIIGSGLNQYTGSILIGNTYYYSHNLILELLVSSGIIGLILYLNIFIISFKNYIRGTKNFVFNRNDYYDKKIAIFGIISFLITAITEAPLFKLYLYMCLVLLEFNDEEKCILDLKQRKSEL